MLLTAGTSVGKTSLAIQIFIHLEAERGRERDAFIRDYRTEHNVSLHAAGHIADNAGLPLLRARYLAETHGLVGQTLEYARSLGLTTAHDGGYDQPFDPAKPGPAACTESERRMLTVKAGAPMPTAACGIDLLGPHCPQRGNCAHWIRRSRCGTAPLVGMTIDRAFDHSLPRELSTGFDFTIIDEGLDRVMFASSEMPLDLFADHHFDQHPVLIDGQPDVERTEEARKGFSWLRYVMNGVEAGYLPAKERDVDRLLRLVELTEARDALPKLTPATSRDDRASIARQSFRPAIRKLCGFMRAWADGPGRISIERDPTKHDSERQIAIVRPKRTLHPSFTEGSVLLIDATGSLDHVRELLPDVVEIAPPLPVAPHQTVVHFADGGRRQAGDASARQQGVPPSPCRTVCRRRRRPDYPQGARSRLRRNTALSDADTTSRSPAGAIGRSARPCSPSACRPCHRKAPPASPPRRPAKPSPSRCRAACCIPCRCATARPSMSPVSATPTRRSARRSNP